MRISGIQTNHFANPTPSPRFEEGARTTAHKIASFIATVFISVGSFFLLPAQAAFLVAGGTALLLSTIFCAEDDEVAPEQQRWYHPIIHAGPRIINWAFNAHHVLQPGGRIVPHQEPIHPVLQPGERIVPGQGHAHPVLVQDHRGQERAPVGRGHQEEAAFRAPPHQNAHPVLPIRMPDGRHQFPPARVPVGQR